jgi:hypothetical protein
MRLRIVLGCLVVLAGASIAGVSVTDGGAASAAAARSHMTTIRFRAHEVLKPRFLDSAPPSGPSAGDEVIEKEVLYAGGQRIGYDLLHATAVIADAKTQSVDVVAEGVLVLKQGTLTFQGETTFRHIRVAIVGGTGAYQHVLGQLSIVRTLSNGDDIDVVRFTDVARR